MFLVNSPVTRAENLRFREQGVRDVISRVLLPWLNSFRFFLGQVALHKKESGLEFKYTPHATVSNNVMDRWILARCQSLIKLVREEMAAYRLYTIVPRLLDLALRPEQARDRAEHPRVVARLAQRVRGARLARRSRLAPDRH